MLASGATISAHASALTGDGERADRQAAGTGYSSSRRASSSRLTCEISPSTSRSRREHSPPASGPRRPAPRAHTSDGQRPADTHTARAARLACTCIPPSRSCGAARPARPATARPPAAMRPPAGRGARAARPCRAGQARPCACSSHKTMPATIPEVNDITARVATAQPKSPRQARRGPHRSAARLPQPGRGRSTPAASSASPAGRPHS